MLSINFDKKKLKYREDTGKLYFSYDDIASLPEWPESPLIELSKGELFIVPSPTPRHQEISGNLYFIIKSYLLKNTIGKIFTAPLDVLLSELDVLVPDLLFVSDENSEIVKEKNIVGVPDMIIEILSSNANRDKIDKKKIYQEFQVKEYLIIDPVNQIVLHHGLRTSGYEIQRFGIGDSLVFETVKGLEIQLSELFNF